MSIDLYGTDEKPAIWQELQVGPLSFEFEQGGVRYVRYGGVEVLRGIAFLVRDTEWNTAVTTLDDVVQSSGADLARITFRARSALPEGNVIWRGLIEATPHSLLFRSEGAADAAVSVNRVGFVVLHPIEGVAGRDMLVEHTDGSSEATRIPHAISPHQPVLDIVALTHAPIPGLHARVELHGETFEMEDQRNWTDASFKTYARPLERPRPFPLAAGEVIAQSVHLEISGAVPSHASEPERSEPTALRFLVPEMPDMVLAVDAADLAGAIEVASALATIAPQRLLLRVDAADQDVSQQVESASDLADQIGAILALDILVNGLDPTPDLADLEDEAVTTLIVSPRFFDPDPGRPDLARAAALAHPGKLVGAGVRTGFTELNRARPNPDTSPVVTHSTSAIVHAADDRSVVETLHGLRHVIASVRAVWHGCLYFLGPCTIGLAEGHAGTPGVRTPAARIDPRHAALFAAAFAVGVLEAAEDVSLLALGHATGDLGVLSRDGAPTPLGLVVQAAARAAGCVRQPVLPRTGLAVVQWAGGGFLLANLTANPVAVDVPHGPPAAFLSRNDHGWGWCPVASGAFALGAYGVLHAVAET